MEKREFWNSLLTEKSWELLQQLRRERDFILIGGWAVYLLTKQHKSKDIDIVISIQELNDIKKKMGAKLGKNDHLKKYEIKEGEIDVDIYVEHYSLFAIPAEDIKHYSLQIEGFTVVRPEALLIFKQSAYEARKHSVKGEKDCIDIASLLFFSDFNFSVYKEILEKYTLWPYQGMLKKLLKGFKNYTYLGLTPHEFKMQKEEVLKKL